MNTNINQGILKTKDEQHGPYQKSGGEFRFFRRVSNSCSTCGTHSFTQYYIVEFKVSIYSLLLYFRPVSQELYYLLADYYFKNNDQA